MDGGDGSKSSSPAAEQQQAGGDPNLIDPRIMARQYEAEMDAEVHRRVEKEVDRRVAAAMAERGRNENVPASVLERLADSIAVLAGRNRTGAIPQQAW